MQDTFIHFNNIITSLIHIVVRVRCRGDRPPHLCGVCIWKIRGDKEFLSFISEKIDWESPPSILVTRNPNWSQRSGTETSYVKGRY